MKNPQPPKPTNPQTNQTNNHPGLIITIIKEELRNRRLFQILKQTGMEDSWFRADLSSIIMENTGLNVECEEEFEFYDRVMEKCVGRVAVNIELSALAQEVYDELADYEMQFTG